MVEVRSDLSDFEVSARLNQPVYQGDPRSQSYSPINWVWINLYPFLAESSGRSNRKNLKNLLGVEVDSIKGHVLPIVNSYLEDCENGNAIFNQDFFKALTLHDFFEDFEKVNESDSQLTVSDKAVKLQRLTCLGVNDFVLATVLTCTKTLNPDTQDKYSKDRNLLQSFAYPFDNLDIEEQKSLLATDCANKLLSYGYIRVEEVEDWKVRFEKLDIDKIMNAARKIKLRDRYHSISQDAMVMLADGTSEVELKKSAGVGGLLYVEKTETLLKTMYGFNDPRDANQIDDIPFAMSIDKEEEILYSSLVQVIEDTKSFEWNIFLNTFEPELKKSHRLDGSTRFDHFIRMEAAIREEFYGGEELPLHLRLAVLLHDIVGDQIARLQEMPKTTLSNVLQEKYPSIFTPDRMKSNHIIYTISVILSAYKFEEAAEAWRKNFLDTNKLDLKDARAIDNALFKSIKDPELRKRFETLIHKLALEEVLDESDKSLVPKLQGIELPMSDIETMVKLLQQLDIEGQLIAAVDCLDNLQYPRPDNFAYVWRDVQELLCFYAPMLDIAGFSSLAYKCYDNAYRWIYMFGFESTSKKDLRIPVKLRRNFGLAEMKMREMEPMIEGFIDKAEEFFGKGNVTLLKRLKSIGSMARKLKGKKYRKSGAVLPDSIGFSLVVDDNTFVEFSTEELISISLTLAEYWQSAIHLKLGHTLSSEPAIQLFHRDVPKVPVKSKEPETTNGDKKQIELNPIKQSGYEAVHINLVDETGVVGLEIKVLSRKVQSNAWIEHAIYTAKEVLGSIGHINRENISQKEILREYFGLMYNRLWDKDLLEVVKRIRERRTKAFYDMVHRKGLYIVNDEVHRRELGKMGFPVEIGNPYHKQVDLELDPVTELS